MFLCMDFFFFHLRHDYYCWKPVLGGEDEFLFLRALQRGLSHCVWNRIPRADPQDCLGPRPKSLSGCGLETGHVPLKVLFLPSLHVSGAWLS